MTDTTEYAKEIKFRNNMVEQNINNCQNRLYDVSMAYGGTSEEYLDMLESFNRAMLNILRLGGTIYACDELSFEGTSFIDYGVLFFPKRTRVEGEVITDPLLGEWSCHS